jgi:hypothetical protein
VAENCWDQDERYEYRCAREADEVRRR